jgi:four helix bundle protein
MKIESFEEVLSWQKAMELNKKLYRSFKSCKDYSFKDQILRASVSIMNNIAEGFERYSASELVRFLYIAKGSCGETRSMILLAFELGYISKEEKLEYLKLTQEISKLIYGLIKAQKKDA